MSATAPELKSANGKRKRNPSAVSAYAYASGGVEMIEPRRACCHQNDAIVNTRAVREIEIAAYCTRPESRLPLG
jgi:hypothetical protein